MDSSSANCLMKYGLKIDDLIFLDNIFPLGAYKIEVQKL